MSTIASRSLLAVTGRTGKYAGARGAASLGAGEDSPLTITLLP